MSTLVIMLKSDEEDLHLIKCLKNILYDCLLHLIGQQVTLLRMIAVEVTESHKLYTD